MSHVDSPVEGEPERHRVETDAPATSPALLHDVDVDVGQHQVGPHRADDHEHLQRHTATKTQRQEEPVRETDAGLEPPAFNVYGLADHANGVYHVVEEAAGPGSLFNDAVHLERVADDCVLAGLQFVHKGIDLNHVEAFVVDAHEAAHAVIFGTYEDADDGVDGLLRGDVNGDLEGLVVEAAHAGNHQEVGALFLHLNVVKVQAVSDVHVVFVHEGDELVSREAVDLYAGEVEVVAGVLGQHFLEEDEGVGDSLHQPPEDRVAQACCVHVQSGGNICVSVKSNVIIILLLRIIFF